MFESMIIIIRSHGYFFYPTHKKQFPYRLSPPRIGRDSIITEDTCKSSLQHSRHSGPNKQQQVNLRKTYSKDDCTKKKVHKLARVNSISIFLTIVSHTKIFQAPEQDLLGLLEATHDDDSIQIYVEWPLWPENLRFPTIKEQNIW